MITFINIPAWNGLAVNPNPRNISVSGDLAYKDCSRTNQGKETHGRYLVFGILVAWTFYHHDGAEMDRAGK